MKDAGPSITMTDVMSGIQAKKLTRIYTILSGPKGSQG